MYKPVALFLRLGLWSTLIRHENRAFFKWEKIENTAGFISFSENILKTELLENDGLTIITWFPCSSFPLSPPQRPLSCCFDRKGFLAVGLGRGKTAARGSLPAHSPNIQAPSTRIRTFSNPQLFLSGYGYRPHASGEFDSESGIKNPLSRVENIYPQRIR